MLLPRSGSLRLAIAVWLGRLHAPSHAWRYVCSAFGCSVSFPQGSQSALAVVQSLRYWLPTVVHTHAMLVSLCSIVNRSGALILRQTTTTLRAEPTPKRSKELGRRQQDCTRCEASIIASKQALTANYPMDDTVLCYSLTADALSVLYIK